ncbi:putative methyltransferase-domain-containing protein [Podospora conica]|nr:putative methyltransferase-domain-containing protein [Schizothecium conicum]
MTPPPPSLPSLREKPPLPTLLTALSSLRLQPPTWQPKTTDADILEQQQADADAAKETLAFLSSIIKNPLPWLASDDERDQVYEEASRRLSERCGRNAMGEITRQWPFPTFTLSIREPPLTGDALGLKTWTSSYILAQLLPSLALHLFPASHPLPPPKILELGAGTGLLGLAAACLWRGADVVLTDLPLIVPNLAHNVALNRAAVEACGGGAVEAAALTWGGEVDARFARGERYQLIIVADPLYDDDHPGLLAGAIHSQLGLDGEARVLVMVPQRDATTRGLHAAFRAAMAEQEVPMVCRQEAMVAGEDSWGDAGDDAGSEGFWWGIFGRALGEEGSR